MLNAEAIVVIEVLKKQMEDDRADLATRIQLLDHTIKELRGDSVLSVPLVRLQTPIVDVPSPPKTESDPPKADKVKPKAAKNKRKKVSKKDQDWSEEIKAEIIAAARDGFNVRSIAQQFGVSHKSIRTICKEAGAELSPAGYLPTARLPGLPADYTIDTSAYQKEHGESPEEYKFQKIWVFQYGKRRYSTSKRMRYGQAVAIVKKQARNNFFTGKVITLIA